MMVLPWDAELLLGQQGLGALLSDYSENNVMDGALRVAAAG